LLADLQGWDEKQRVEENVKLLRLAEAEMERARQHGG